MIVNLSFKDTQCGFKAFTRPAAAAIFPLQNIERWGFDPELLFLAKKFKFKVAEVPVEWAHREGTRINPLRDGAKMFLEMLKIRRNDLTENIQPGEKLRASGQALGPLPLSGVSSFARLHFENSLDQQPASIVLLSVNRRGKPE